MTRRFLIIASAIILIGALVGGTIGRSKRFRRSVPGNGVTTYTEADERRILNRMGARFGNDIQLRIEYVSEIQKTPRGKTALIVREIE